MDARRGDHIAVHALLDASPCDGRGCTRRATVSVAVQLRSVDLCSRCARELYARLAALLEGAE
jgi:hypothetical protein